MTNQERKAAIGQLHAQLRVDQANLEKKYREDSGALTRECRLAVANLEREIKEAAAAEIAQARLEVQRILVAAGLRAEQVLAGAAIGQLKARKPTKPSVVRHTGPQGQVWSGRGRAPHWFRRQQGEIGVGHG